MKTKLFSILIHYLMIKETSQVPALGLGEFPQVCKYVNLFPVSNYNILFLLKTEVFYQINCFSVLLETSRTFEDYG